MLALLMIETLVSDCKYIRLMYLPRGNSAATVVGGPGLGGVSGRSSRGFHGVQGLPSSSTPAGLPPVPLNGFDDQSPAAETVPGPCASARSPFALFTLERTMCV